MVSIDPTNPLMYGLNLSISSEVSAPELSQIFSPVARWIWERSSAKEVVPNAPCPPEKNPISHPSALQRRNSASMLSVLRLANLFISITSRGWVDM